MNNNRSLRTWNIAEVSLDFSLDTTETILLLHPFMRREKSKIGSRPGVLFSRREQRKEHGRERRTKDQRDQPWNPISFRWIKSSCVWGMREKKKRRNQHNKQTWNTSWKRPSSRGWRRWVNFFSIPRSLIKVWVHFLKNIKLDFYSFDDILLFSDNDFDFSWLMLMMTV